MILGCGVPQSGHGTRLGRGDRFAAAGADTASMAAFSGLAPVVFSLKLGPSVADVFVMTPGKILLIEDEPSNSRLMEVTLRPLGYETLIRADGSSGLEAAHDESIELIVLDIALPKLDGWQVLDRLRNDPDTMAIPVLVLTAHVGDENLMKAADGGADVFMTKPFQPDDLRQVVRALIQQRRETLAQRNGNPTS